MAEVRLSVVGDVAFCRSLGHDPVSIVDQMDSGVREAIAGDILLVNFECAMRDDVPEELIKENLLAMVGPTSGGQALKRMGVTLASLANTHSLDGGVEGLRTTIETLRKADIIPFGAGPDIDQATAVPVIEQNGLRIGFVGFGGSYVAGKSRAGTLPLDLRESRQLIQHARTMCDFLVVYFHEGIEAIHYPMKSTVAACHQAAECGADLVIGTHPHTIQGIEWYRGVPIAYSLGNFLFPLLASDLYDIWQPQTLLGRLGIPFDRKVIARQMVLRCTFSSDRTVRIETIPLFADETCLPHVPHNGESAEATAFIERLNEAFNNPDAEVWRERDRIERELNRMLRRDIQWKDVFKRLHRLRWRHLVNYWKMVRG